MKKLAIAILCLMSASVYAQQKNFYGVGGLSCEKFVDSYESVDSQKQRFLDWITGYISGSNHQTESQWVYQPSSDIVFVLAECKKAPRKPLVYILNQLNQ